MMSPYKEEIENIKLKNMPPLVLPPPTYFTIYKLLYVYTILYITHLSIIGKKAYFNKNKRTIDYNN